jgi:hypothetical protein
MIPRPEVCVSASWTGDFRDEATFACWEFKRVTGRLPNFVGVTLEQVEALEDAYNVSGIDACNPPGVPLLFVEARGEALPTVTMLRLPPAAERIPITGVTVPSDPQ